MALKAWRQGEPRSPEAKYYSGLFCDLRTVRDIMLGCGIAVGLGKDFYADPLTFDDERLPAKLYGPELPSPQESEDEDSEKDNPPVEPWKIFVPDAPGKNKHWTIPEFFASHVTKKPITHLSRGEQMMWGLRALYESGVLGNIDLPPVRSVRLPEDGISKDSKTPLLYEGILSLVRLRLLYNPAETEHLFAYTFMRRWCDIGSDSTIRDGLKWLSENGYIKVVRRVPNPGRADTLYYDLAAPSVSSLAKDEDAEGLIEVFRDFDSAVRDEAMHELVKLGPLAVEPLIVVLTDEDEEVSKRSSWALNQIRGPAVQPLIAALQHAGDELRTEVIYLLGVIGGDEALEALLGVLEDGDIEAQREAIRALAHMKDKRAVDPLRRIEKLGCDEELRHSAEQAANKILGLPSDIW